MSQILNIFGIDWHILLVQVVNFAVLMGLLWYFLYKPFTKLIEERRAKIIEGVANAERAETTMRDADAKKGEIITKASLEAEAVVAAARTAARAREAQLTKEAQEKYERTLAEAALKGEEIKREALRESREEIARLIVLGVEKTLAQKNA